MKTQKIEQTSIIEEKSGADVIQGLTRSPKTLPPKYFYDARGSELFEQICQLPEYYPTRTEAAILREYASEIAQLVGACELVELGSGSSSKTRLLLDAYQSLGYHCKYVPIDISETILNASAIQLQTEYPQLEIEALVGTYEQAIAQFKPTTLPRRMIFFLGSSIGNFTPEECDRFFHQVGAVLAPGDYFLLGIDLQKPTEILEAAYNDSQGVTAAFNLNILSHLNWRFQGNFDLSLFTHQAIYNQTENQIEMYLHCQKNHVVYLQSLDLTVTWKKGESILTEISRKFDLEQVEKDLKSKGLPTLKTFTDSQNWFGLILCKVGK
ncbi:MAG TPA: L-histidine N(alpha)-methyltransferase [Cyanobacteria bacterium UBA11149]|nr:L-histidine N(alpha)-methyltransferase [Cyanobacteria bacterium UBA11367]HBE60540.1 L-histidine N(alpha)-methyltransferase [Cyanobacteria bacterium UBA11366]HBK63770.1 L-histidine N(alpha)-methyltransferase [Cyanobacteria bacterium UBA11166]HBR72876.1 L-histidine N(alpha)-methyltransferase [Cyanobacteria bacterium UBA11159]HBS68989.1 L-histidine N(alpha)-methyltransferase [Cyanobacteria bacterium UBA11153]HBW88542.1 L-histidine N(alpha)-methyltransferase [Cyanobacteria bacterium UBA11149]H